jgi:hypothetical protein
MRLGTLTTARQRLPCGGGSPESCSFKPPGMANDESEEGLALRVRFRTSLYLFALRRGGV